MNPLIHELTVGRPIVRFWQWGWFDKEFVIRHFLYYCFVQIVIIEYWDSHHIYYKSIAKQNKKRVIKCTEE